MIRLLMTVGFALVTTQASAQVAVPKSYVDGEVIDADELNTNLEAIAGAVPPRTCTTDQIIKWDGSAWVCADMPSSNTGGDGAAYGSPVWVDSSGTVLTGRDGGYTVFILNGTFQLPGRIVNGTYANASDYAYYLQSGCQGTAYYYAATDSEFVALPGSPNWQVRSGIAGDITIRSRLKTSSNSCEEQETYTSELYQELLDSGIPAPSWLADGTEAFKGLR